MTPPDDDRLPVLPYAGTSGWSGTDTSRDRADRRDHDGSTESLQRRLLVTVAQTGAEGLTVADARRWFPEHHGSISGALSNLHATGRLALLEGRRYGCHPYVLPQYVAGRATRPQGRDMTNRTRGDYFERQTRDALEGEGWIVLRSAGSLGPADLVALRAGQPTMLVACKTNGRIGPAERATLADAATIAGAQPVLACRTQRGWVDLHDVRADGVDPRRLQVKAPSRR